MPRTLFFKRFLLIALCTMCLATPYKALAGGNPAQPTTDIDDAPPPDIEDLGKESPITFDENDVKISDPASTDTIGQIFTIINEAITHLEKKDNVDALSIKDTFLRDRIKTKTEEKFTLRNVKDQFIEYIKKYREKFNLLCPIFNVIKTEGPIFTSTTVFGDKNSIHIPQVIKTFIEEINTRNTPDIPIPAKMWKNVKKIEPILTEEEKKEKKEREEREDEFYKQKKTLTDKLTLLESKTHEPTNQLLTKITNYLTKRDELLFGLALKGNFFEITNLLPKIIIPYDTENEDGDPIQIPVPETIAKQSLEIFVNFLHIKPLIAPTDYDKLKSAAEAIILAASQLATPIILNVTPMMAKPVITTRTTSPRTSPDGSPVAPDEIKPALVVKKFRGLETLKKDLEKASNAKNTDSFKKTLDEILDSPQKKEELLKFFNEYSDEQKTNLAKEIQKVYTDKQEELTRLKKQFRLIQIDFKPTALTKLELNDILKLTLDDYAQSLKNAKNNADKQTALDNIDDITQALFAIFEFSEKAATAAAAIKEGAPETESEYNKITYKTLFEIAYEKISKKITAFDNFMAKLKTTIKLDQEIVNDDKKVFPEGTKKTSLTFEKKPTFIPTGKDFEANKNELMRNIKKTAKPTVRQVPLAQVKTHVLTRPTPPQPPLAAKKIKQLKDALTIMKNKYTELATTLKDVKAKL